MTPGVSVFHQGGGSGSGGSGDVVGPASGTDNALVRFDGATGKLVQNGLASESDSGVITADGLLIYPGGNQSADEKVQVGAATILIASDIPIKFYNDPDISSGSPDVGLERSAAGTLEVTNGSTGQGNLTAARLDVDNLRLDGNTLSATDANGSVIAAYAGTGALCINSTTSSDPALRSTGSGGLRVVHADAPTAPSDLHAQSLRLYQSGFTTSSFVLAAGAGAYMGVYDVSGTPRIKFTRSSNAENAHDAGVSSPAAGIVAVDNGSTGGGALQLKEMTAPAALADTARIFTEDNGLGKTRLMVQFGTGAAVLLAIEV